MNLMNTRAKFEVRSFTCSWDNRGYSKNLGSPWIRPRSLFSEFFMGFCSHGPCEYIPAWYTAGMRSECKCLLCLSAPTMTLKSRTQFVFNNSFFNHIGLGLHCNITHVMQREYGAYLNIVSSYFGYSFVYSSVTHPAFWLQVFLINSVFSVHCNRQRHIGRNICISPNSKTSRSLLLNAFFRYSKPLKVT